MSKTGYIEAVAEGKRLTKRQRDERMADSMEHLRSLLSGVKHVFAIKLPYEGSRHPRWRLYILIVDDIGENAQMTMREISSIVQGASEWQWDKNRSALIGDPYDTTGRTFQHWLNKTWPEVKVVKI